MAGSRAASAGLCASLLLSAAAPVLCADPPVQVHLTFAGGPSDVASIRDAVVAEGAAVWLPYDVVVGTHAAGACDEAGELDMGVRVDRGGSRTEGRDGLGAVRFDADGVPETVVTLHAGAIASLATSVTSWAGGPGNGRPACATTSSPAQWAAPWPTNSAMSSCCRRSTPDRD